MCAWCGGSEHHDSIGSFLMAWSMITPAPVCDLVRVRHIFLPRACCVYELWVGRVSRRHVLLSRSGPWVVTHPHHKPHAHHARTGILCPGGLLGGARP